MRVHPEPTSGCWIWVGARDKKGYGHFGRRCEMAHRFVYKALGGLIPPAYHLDHLCRNRARVNPAHLEPVLPVENTRRGNVVRFGRLDDDEDDPAPVVPDQVGEWICECGAVNAGARACELCGAPGTLVPA